MICPNCHFENPAESIFCGKCGFPLEGICPYCGAKPPKNFNFCNICGQALNKQQASLTPSQSPTTPDPSSFADNRYQIKDLLGEGGKKKVYRAYDTLLDREVALALIKTEGLDEGAKARITREAQAMGRVGTHPHIVTVFDLGEEDGQPFIVSEILAGGDVEGLIEKAAGHKLDMDHVIDIAQSICEGLQFAHNKGIVHRDLKPSNVYLTDDGVVKIGDFGLALVDDRTRLTMEGMMVGTVSYMAPEQATGGEVTPQSDLYSLGAMLYEMSTGRPPFVGDDHVAIIGQHINTPPVSPSWHNKDIPSSVEKLILSLLEKNPGDRPTSASSMIQSLGLIKQGEVSEDIVLEPTEADKRAPVYRQVFVGRENELKQLKTAFNNALSGQGSLVMVVGEPGIGKTAITQQLATYVTMRGGLTLVGHCYEEGSLSLPYLAFVEAMRTYVLNREETDLRRVMGTGASEVARIVSEVRDKLQVEPSPPTNPDEDRYRLFQAVTDFLSNASEVQPLLIVLEDLHDADKGTLDLLVYVTRRMGKGRFLMVGTYRDVEVDRTHPLVSTLAELRRVSTYERVLLRGLTIDEVQRMLSSLSGQEVNWQIAEAVHKQTEGNPLFIQEVLRYAVEEGLIMRESGEWRAVDQDRLLMSIPEGLRDVIGKRLSNLSPEYSQVLSIASVMGREFRFEVLQKVSDIAEEDLFSTLKEAIAAAVIEERPLTGAAVMYRFSHAFIRQALYEEMIIPRRNRLHIQIAHALEEVFVSRLAEHAVELSDHFSHSTHSEDLSKAVHYGEMAAQRASSVFDHGEAVRLLKQSLQVQEVLDPEDKVKKCDLLLKLAKELINSGEARQALEVELTEAFTMGESIKDKLIPWKACKLAIDALQVSHTGVFTTWISEEGRKWITRADQYAKENTSERAMTDFLLGVGKYSVGLAIGDTVQIRTGSLMMSGAVKQIRKIGDNEASWFVMPLWFTYGSTPQRFEERLILAEEMLQRWHSGQRPQTMAVTSLLFIGNIFLEYEKRKICEEIWSERNRIIERSRQDFHLVIEATRILMDTIDGKLEEALKGIKALMSKGRDYGRQETASINVLFVGMRPNYLLGNIEGLLESLPPRPRIHQLRALFLAALNKQDEAREILDIMLKGRPNIGTGDDYMWYWIDVVFLEAAVLSGHQKAAEALLNQLAKKTPNITATYFATCVPRHFGAAARMLGRPEEARNYYHEAIRASSNVGFRPEIALTRFQLAELLFEHYPDEKDDAIEHLNFAIDEFKEMKMQPSLEKAEKLKTALG